MPPAAIEQKKVEEAFRNIEDVLKSKLR